MKLAVSITVLLIFFFTLDGYSQTVTLSGIDMPLKRVLNTIKSQTGYIFFYEEKLMKEARPVTIGVKNAPVEKVLNQIFEEQPLTWLLEDRTITINRKPAQAITPQTTNADQTYRITGTVKDPEGGPVDAASVTIKGTGRGTITNENGVFSMEARRGSVLVVSSVSYGKKEIRVKDPSPVIQFDLDARPMEKMVIGGNIMPIQRKATVASIAVIDRKTLESQHSQSIDLIYRGVVAGTNHIQAGYETPQYNYFSGTVSIRGISDFSGYGILKVYVDGVQFAAGSYLLNTLDKNSIDHIEVVKGPSSSMLYGSRADGGVLLIYTKKPALNTTNISLTSSAGWYDSKWQDKKPFRQLHAFTVSQGFENVSYMLAGDFNKYETYMPCGRQNSEPRCDMVSKRKPPLP